MKRKNRSNFIMVALIAVIMLSGIIGAYFMMGEENRQLGALFSNPDLTNETGENTCTVTIRCDTALANKDKLNQAKMPYVPEDGIILSQLSVAFTPGETAFAVLQRVCEKGDIQLEYSWTPIYDSYYVEGINHLYEFDCGPESGWMYKVNGAFPNYGCSSYELKDGDEVVWIYTCDGLGTDVGAEGMAKAAG